MKAMISVFISSLFTVGLANAEIWEKPPYRPDENHLPKEQVTPKEAQEETPEEIKDQKYQDVQKPDSNPRFEEIKGAKQDENEPSTN